MRTAFLIFVHEHYLAALMSAIVIDILLFCIMGSVSYGSWADFRHMIKLNFPFMVLRDEGKPSDYFLYNFLLGLFIFLLAVAWSGIAWLHSQPFR